MEITFKLPKFFLSMSRTQSDLERKVVAPDYGGCRATSCCYENGCSHGYTDWKTKSLDRKHKHRIVMDRYCYFLFFPLNNTNKRKLRKKGYSEKCCCFFQILSPVLCQENEFCNVFFLSFALILLL